MSTKEIRRVLDNLADERGERLVRAALAEVAALEKAAAIMQHAEPPLWDMTHEQQREAEKAQELLVAIARQGGEQ